MKKKVQMFYQTVHTKDFYIDPKDLDVDIEKTVKNKIQELEGTIIGKSGYIVAILKFETNPIGKIEREHGRVDYSTTYTALTFVPQKETVYYAKVHDINEYGFYCSIGPMNRIIINHHMLKDKGYVYDNTENTFTNDENTIEINNVLPIKILDFLIYSNRIQCVAELQ